MSVIEQSTKQALPSEDKVVEINLRDIVYFLKLRRWTILLAGIIGAIVGAVYAFSKPNVYTAQVTVMPEIQSKGTSGLGNLSSLAGLAGVNLDNLSSMQDALRPELYPTILQSVPFALDLLQKSVYSQKLNTTLSLQAFTEQMEDKGFTNHLLKLFSISDEVEEKPLDPKNFSQAIQITKKQDRLIKEIQTTVTAAYDKKTSFITISVIEPDQVVAATVSRLSLEYLTNYIINYRTEKARQQLNFLIKQVNEAQNRYKLSEYALSAYRDRNRNLFLNTAKIDEQRLQADYILAQSVYSDLTKQLEQAKIKVQQETPVFKTLEPPQVPLIKSGPKRLILILIFVTCSCLINLIYLLVRYFNRK